MKELMIYEIMLEKLKHAFSKFEKNNFQILSMLYSLKDFFFYFVPKYYCMVQDNSKISFMTNVNNKIK